MSKMVVDRTRILARGLVLFATCAIWAVAGAAETVFHLKAGDRISGTILSENAAVVILSNAWARGISIPRNEIVRREPLLVATPVPPAPARTEPAAQPLPGTPQCS